MYSTANEKTLSPYEPQVKLLATFLVIKNSSAITFSLIAKVNQYFMPMPFVIIKIFDNFLISKECNTI